MPGGRRTGSLQVAFRFRGGGSCDVALGFYTAKRWCVVTFQRNVGETGFSLHTVSISSRLYLSASARSYSLHWRELRWPCAESHVGRETALCVLHSAVEFDGSLVNMYF
jgi:hypothetical protein